METYIGENMIDPKKLFEFMKENNPALDGDNYLELFAYRIAEWVNSGRDDE